MFGVVAFFFLLKYILKNTRSVCVKQFGGRVHYTQTKTGNDHYISLLVIYRSLSAAVCVVLSRAIHTNVLQTFE